MALTIKIRAMTKFFIQITIVLTLLSVTCQEEPCITPDNCNLKPSLGPCDGFVIIYYYDSDSGKCREYMWGGCDGHVPFETLEACEECICNND